MQEDQIARATQPATTSLVTQYVAPRIESVLTPDGLEREVLYAGSTDSIIVVKG